MLPASTKPTNGRAEEPAHILAINDDQAVLGLFRDPLTEEGYRVSTQAYIDKDLAKVARLAPDLIILDYMWADEDAGWSMLQMLQMNPTTASIPIILCTGAVREVEGLSAHLDTMGVRIVLKPFNISQLLDLITEMLSTAADTADRANPSG